MLEIIKNLLSIVLKLLGIKNKKLPRAASDTHIYWRKKEIKKLSKHFSTKEFECPCKLDTCRLQKIAVELIQKLEQVRLILDKKLIITSGYRCKRYQNILQKRGYKTAKRSQHLQGNAADFTFKEFTDTDKDVLLGFLYKYFKAIGMGSSFCHVDLRHDKKRYWSY